MPSVPSASSSMVGGNARLLDSAQATPATTRGLPVTMDSMNFGKVFWLTSPVSTSM